MCHNAPRALKNSLSWKKTCNYFDELKFIIWSNKSNSVVISLDAFGKLKKEITLSC